MKPTPHRLEEISLNAWPALQTVLYDGWLLRLANGYTRRANSATCLYPGQRLLAEKIDRVAQFYRAQQLPPVFRLTPITQPPDLEAALTQRGYRREAPTSVQYLDLAGTRFSRSERAMVLNGRSGLTAWLDAFHQLNPHRADWQTHQQILSLIVGPLCPMILTVNDTIIGFGLAVLSGHALGIFDMVVAADKRRQGYGRELMLSLLAWGRDHQADYAWLQVMVENEMAQQLYAKLGFQEQYRYWYRVGEPD